MSFDFPNSPTEGQVYVAVADGITFIYQNGRWMRKSDDAPVDGLTYGRKNNLWSQVNDQAYPDAPADNTIYVRKNNAWVPFSFISDTAPVSPVQGQFWWNSLNGNLYIYYNDGSSAQWVQINNTGAL